MKIMHEQWIQLKLIEGLCDKYRIAGVFDGLKLFKIFLLDTASENKAEVIIGPFVDSYLHAHKINRVKTINRLKNEYGEKFYENWTFFKVINSEYLQWFLEESQHIYDANFMHFSFIGDDSILDVITSGEPEVAIVNEFDSLYFSAQ